MRSIFRTAKAGIVLVAAFGSVSCAHARGSIELSPSSDWQFRQFDDKCRASRNFGEGENRTSLWIEQGGTEPSYNLTLIGRPLRHPYGAGIYVKFGDEPESVRSYLAAESSKGRPVLRMYGLTLVQPQLGHSEADPVPEVRLDEARLNAISTLNLRSSIVKPLKLDLGPMGEPFAFLARCGSFVSAMLTEAGRPLSGEATPPVPIKLKRWLSMADWPRWLTRARIGGKVVARLAVDKQGKASSCFITETNKPQLFDDAVCLGLLKRAKFEPALNAKKEPVASYFFYTITFGVD